MADTTTTARERKLQQNAAKALADLLEYDLPTAWWDVPGSLSAGELEGQIGTFAGSQDERVAAIRQWAELLDAEPEHRYVGDPAENLSVTGMHLGTQVRVWTSVSLPAVEDDAPACRVCSCTKDRPCEGGCRRVPDPERLGDICSAHFVTAETLTDGQVVRCVDWAGGDEVRIIHADKTIDGPVAVHYQDVRAHHPATLVHVDPDHLAVPAGGAR